MPRAQRSLCGWTLVETAVVLALVGTLVALAWPSQLGQLQRARRMDATSALQRLQFAQERYRATHGLYALDLAALGLATLSRSAEGLYELSARDGGSGSVLLAARARDEGPQHADRECREITLRLNDGLADAGPSGRCWNQ